MGETSSILMKNVLFNTCSILLDANGATVATDDDSEGDQNAEITSSCLTQRITE